MGLKVGQEENKLKTRKRVGINVEKEENSRGKRA